MASIPVVDFEPISSQDGHVPSEENWDSVSKQIDTILSGVGFVYLKNHGITEESIQRAFKESKTFFELGPETKLKYLTDHVNKGFFGYTEPNQEQLDPGSAYEFRESFDLSIGHGTLDQEQSIERLSLDVPNFLPALRALETECRPLIDKLHRILARGLKLADEEYFIKSTRSIRDPQVPSYSTFRSLYYPAVPESMEIGPGTLRCAPHSDYGTLTLLFQDGIGGLEVKNSEKNWTPATPIPGTVLVNTGDLLYFWSGGRYPATVHRVLIPESEVKKRVARQSITYFLHPDDHVMVSPLNATNSDSITPVSAYEHARMKLERSYKY